MWVSCMDTMYLLRVLCLCVPVFMGVCCRSFELQDTIHSLIEENIHLHDQLENLTAALRELRQLLLHHSTGRSHDNDADLQHRWQQWSQHNISPETHMLLEQALCGHELHGLATSTTEHISTFLMFIFIILTHLLL